MSGRAEKRGNSPKGSKCDVNGRRKDEGRKRSVYRNGVSEGNNLLSRTFVAMERITVWSGMGDQCAAEDSKWSLLIIMWTAGL